MVDEKQGVNEMKKFTMKADIEFYADDIVDAFMRLARHFDSLIDDEDSQLITLGEIKIEPAVLIGQDAPVAIKGTPIKI